MLMVGLLAWATSCGGLGCAVAAEKREVSDVDHYVKKSFIFSSLTSEYIIKNENTLQLGDRRFRRDSSLQAVCDTPIARITSCVSPLRI